MRRLKFAVFTFLSLLVAPAYALALTEDEASRFVESLSTVLEEKSIYEQHFEDEGEIVGQLSVETFQPYTDGVKNLRKNAPSDYRKLGKTVSKHGFASPEDWAKVGDTTMAAYLVVKMEGMRDELESMVKMMSEQVTPEMLESMPPEARAQLEAGQSMLEAMHNVPKNDVEAVRSVVPELDAISAENG